MPELSVDDLEQYSAGGEDDAERQLAAALAAARRYCGWHVTPIRVADVVTVDGTGGPLLSLPTLNVVALTAITEDGDALDVADVSWSPRGLLRKRSGARWAADYGSITITMDHGFPDAPDWQAAVLDLADRMSMVAANSTASSGGALVRKRVAEVEYQWQATQQPLGVDEMVKPMLEPYRLRWLA